MLSTLGILALAALGGGASPAPHVDGVVCTMPAPAEPEGPAMSVWVAATPPPDWCTERDSMTDPRCSPVGQGRPTGAPASGYQHRLDPASVGQVPEVAPLVRAAAPPTAPLRGPGHGVTRRLLRPPRAPAGA
ncbi:MAG: hypothetical protein H6730_09650 [Deltaproteobacteria bacterium]|nr:hypothetical protein [Deltaproteobacteria bacterium]